MVGAFSLLGHLNPTKRYPAAVIPVGTSNGRVVACYSSDSEDDSLSAPQCFILEPIQDGEYVHHGREVAAKLKGFDFRREFLYALEDGVVIACPWERAREFAANLLKRDPYLIHASAFTRLALAKQSEDPYLIAAALRECAVFMLMNAPVRAGRWFTDVVEPMAREWAARGQVLPIPPTLRQLAEEASDRPRKRKTFGLVVDILGPYQVAVLNGVEEAAIEYDLDLVVVLAGRMKGVAPKSEAYGIHQLLTPSTVDGIMLMSGALQLSENDARQFADYYFAHRTGIPVVSIALEAPGVPSVSVNATPGLTEELDHLFNSHGCRRIAFIAGPADNAEARERLGVYESVTKEKGIYDESLIVHGDFLMPSGRAAMSKLLEHPRPFDAVVAASDAMALGALDELRARGRDKDVIVVGYDDLPEAGASVPSLTTVHQPLQELGRAAVKMLRRLTSAEADYRMSEPHVFDHVHLSTSLVVRDSCGTHEASSKLDDRLLSKNIITPIELDKLRVLSSVLGVNRERLLKLLRLCETSHGDEFLAEVDALIREDGTRFAPWHLALEELREYLLSRSDTALERTRIETLMFKASSQLTMAAHQTLELERSKRLAERLRLQARRYVLGAMTADLSGARSTEDVLKTVARHIGSLSEPCALCLHEETQPPFRRCHGNVFHDEAGGVAINEARSFELAHLAPPGMLPERSRRSIVIFPLRMNEPLGYFTFVLNEHGDWRVYELLAAHVGRALHEARSVEEQVLGQRFLKSIPPAESELGPLLTYCADQARIALNADLVTVYPYLEEESTIPVEKSGPGIAGLLHERGEMVWPVSDGDAVRTVLRLNKDMYVENTLKPPAEARQMFSDSRGRVRFYIRERIASVAALLLRHRSTIVGIMFVNYRTPTQFSAKLKENMQVCTSHSARVLWDGIRTRGTIQAAAPESETAFSGSPPSSGIVWS